MKSGNPRREKEGRSLFRTQISIVKEAAEAFHLALQLNLELNGVFGVVLFPEKPSLLRPNEKELESSVSEPFKLGTEFGELRSVG